MPTPTIYKITNTKNDKIYVGSAINFRKRKNNHLYYLRKDNHCNLHLQRAYNAYGEENFRWEIIEYLDDVNKLIEREQYWIDILDAYNENIGYNLYPIAGSPLGHICSKVEVTNLTTSEIFSSMTEAANAYGVSRPSISSACRGLSKYSANCRWSY